MVQIIEINLTSFFESHRYVLDINVKLQISLTGEQVFEVVA